MPIERKLTDEELKFGILIHDPLLFPLFFWKNDLTIPHTREDLPEEWRGRQILSKEQRLMFCDQSPRVLLCTARKVAKTLLIERDVVQLGLVNYRDDGGLDEAMFFTPGEAQISPVRARIFSKLQGVPLFKMFTSKLSGKEGGAGMIHFKTGLKWHLRIEGISGTDASMAGLRAKYILGDELAFGNQICHNSRGQTALPEAKWKYCGVPNGIRSTPFYDLDQTSLGQTWSRHKYPSNVNPLYRSKRAWQQLVEFYGGVNTQGFITQALGEWGAEVFSSFPPGTIASKSLPFLYIELTNKEVRGDLDDAYLSRFIRLPDGVNPAYIYQAVLGWDYGFSPDPCVMTFFYRTSEEDINWYELLRLRLMRVPIPSQARIVDFINARLLNNRLLGICTDDAGCVQQLQTGERYYAKFANRVMWANSSGAVPLLDQFGDPMVDESGKPINVRRKEWAHIEFKNAMQYGLIHVPNPFYMWLSSSDESLIEELAGTIERRRASGYIEFLAPRKTPGSQSPDDHATDSCRFSSVAIHHVLVPKETEDRSFEAYRGVLGWTGVAPIESELKWQPPWA